MELIAGPPMPPKSGSAAPKPLSSEELLPLVYEELRQLAARRIAGESGPRTLQPTALVHEAWIRLRRTQGGLWQNRAARIVSLKFFSGLASAEIARIEGCSTRSVERRWSFAKARLYQMIRAEGFARGPATP